MGLAAARAVGKTRDRGRTTVRRALDDEPVATHPGWKENPADEPTTRPTGLPGSPRGRYLARVARRLGLGRRHRHERVRSLKVTVLSTMLADTKGIGEWGFAALVEADGHRLLFDTGARPETVLTNARELGVDLAGVTDVVLSHHHGDHTGGLLPSVASWRRPTPALSRVYVGPGIFLPRPARGRPRGERDDRLEGALRGDRGPLRGGRPADRGLPRRLADRAGAPHATPSGTGAAEGRSGRPRAWSRTRSPRTCRWCSTPSEGLVVVTGCGHAGVVNTLEYARKTVRQAPVYAAWAGLHLFPADEATLDWTAGKLRDGGWRHLLGAHCTGVEAVYALRSRLGPRPRAPAWSGRSARGSTSSAGSDPGTIAR